MDAHVGHHEFSRLPFLDIRGDDEAARDLSRHAACVWRDASSSDCYVQLGWPGPGELIRPRGQARVLRQGRPQDALTQPFRLTHRDVLRLTAALELDYLARALVPPCQVGAYALTGVLGRSATALLFTAQGGLFHGEGVLKLTGTAYAPILHRELALLNRCAQAQIAGVVAPASPELVLLSVGDADADRLAAAIALPFLTGGDLLVVVDRAARGGRLGPRLALELARPLATVLRHLLEDLPTPIAHGDLQPRNVLLPRAGAPLAEIVLIDFDAAREIADDRSPLADDVHAFGELLRLLSTGHAERVDASADKGPFGTLVRRCRVAPSEGYASLADDRFWADLRAAEEVMFR